MSGSRVTVPCTPHFWGFLFSCLVLSLVPCKVPAVLGVCPRSGSSSFSLHRNNFHQGWPLPGLGREAGLQGLCEHLRVQRLAAPPGRAVLSCWGWGGKRGRASVLMIPGAFAVPGVGRMRFLWPEGRGTVYAFKQCTLSVIQTLCTHLVHARRWHEL